MSQPFAVLSPNAGLELDSPSQFLANQKASSSQNLEYYDGLLRSRLGLLKQIADAVGTPFLRLDEYKNLDQTLYFLGCTTTDIFELDLAASKPMYLTPTYAVGIVQVVNGSAVIRGGRSIDPCDTSPVAWVTDQGANAVVSRDTSVFNEGTASVKIALGAGATTGLVAHHQLDAALDLSAEDSIGFWFRSDTALSSGDFKILLDDTGACTSAIEAIDLPAISANTWTWVNVAMADPSLCTAILAVGLRQVVDKGAMNCYIDGIVSGDWVDQISVGDKFRLGAVNDGAFASQVWYTVLTVDSDTQITLSANYAETSASAQAYTLRMLYTGGATDYWDTCEFTDASLGRIWVATNGVDVLQYWNATGQMKTLGGSPPKCKYLQPYLDHLFAIWCIVAGQDQPQQIQWCAAGNAQSWPATYVEYLVDTPGEITGRGTVGTYIAITKERAKYLGRYVGGDFLFDFEPRDSGGGCFSPWSIIPWLGGIYYYGNDQAFHYWDGIQDKVVSQDILPFIRNFDADLQHFIYGIRMDSVKQIRWFVATAGASGFDQVVVLSLLNDSMEVWPYDGSGHLGVPGNFHLESDLYVDDSVWGELYVDEQIGYWDDRTFLANAPVTFYGGSDGYLRLADTGTDDDGTDILSIFRSKRLDYDMPQKRKRLNRVQGWFGSEVSGSVLHRIRINDKSDFTLVGEMSLIDTTRDIVKPSLVVDRTSDVFEHEFRTTDHMEFLGFLSFVTLRKRVVP